MEAMPTPAEQEATIRKAGNLIAQMQEDAIKKLGVTFRINYFCNVLAKAKNEMPADISEKDFNAKFNWDKINALLLHEISETDFNLIEKVKSFADLIELRNRAITASCDVTPWRKQKCKDCKEDFYMYYGEVSFYKDKGLHMPCRCKSCRNIRKNKNN